MTRSLWTVIILACACGRTDLLLGPALTEERRDAGTSIIPPPPNELCASSMAGSGRISIDFAPEIPRQALSSGGFIVYVDGTVIHRFDPRTNDDRVLGDGVTIDVALDAHGGALLSRSTVPGFSTLFLTALDEDTDPILLDSARSARVFAAPLLFDGSSPRWVERDRAVWSREGELFAFDAHGRRSIAQRIVSVDPALRGPRLAWIEDTDPDPDLILTALGGRLDRTALTADDGPADARPAIGSDAIFWLSGPSVARAPLSNLAQVERLHRGRCGPPSADGDRAVFLCGAENTALFRTLHLYEGGVVRPIPTGGGFLAVARIWNDLIAWIEYDDTNALCFEDPRGTVFIASLTQAVTTPEPLGRAGGPCLCCTETGPPLELNFEDGVLAWNYFLADDTHPRPTQVGDVGWARFVCPR